MARWDAAHVRGDAEADPRVRRTARADGHACVPAQAVPGCFAGGGESPGERVGEGVAGSEGVKLFIARHGETTWNVAGREMGQLDSPLTERGVLQAEALARRL